MTYVPTMSADLSIYSDEDFGLRIECSAKHADKIKQYLSVDGYQCDNDSIVDEGTISIHATVGFDVKPDEFDNVKESVMTFLTGVGVKCVEEQFNFEDEKCSRINLTNLSVLDK